jgi:hypothetical protein
LALGQESTDATHEEIRIYRVRCLQPRWQPGLNIFANGYPKSQPIDCTTKEPTGPAESTSTPGGSGLTYNASTDRYTYPWRTSSGWRDTCRQLIVRLHDSTEHVAYFRFT